MSAATLPDRIDNEPLHGKQQAQRLAAHAEQALLSLRTILVELRPSQVLIQGFPDALEALCAGWETSPNMLRRRQSRSPSWKAHDS